MQSLQKRKRNLGTNRITSLTSSIQPPYKWCAFIGHRPVRFTCGGWFIVPTNPNKSTPSQRPHQVLHSSSWRSGWLKFIITLYCNHREKKYYSSSQTCIGCVYSLWNVYIHNAHIYFSEIERETAHRLQIGVQDKVRSTLSQHTFTQNSLLGSVKEHVCI